MNEYKKFGYFYDEMMDRLNYDLWLEFVEPYLKKGDKILDVACGTGTFCNMLTLKGFECSGLDLSEHMIEIAQEKARVNHMDIPFYVQDMTKFKIKEKFDVITCFFDSINFLKSEKDIKDMLDCVVAHLKKGGYFICDIFAKSLFDDYVHEELVEDHETFKIKWVTEQVNGRRLRHAITIEEPMEEPFTEVYYEHYYEPSVISHKNLHSVKYVGDFNDDIAPEDERIIMVFQRV